MENLVRRFRFVANASDREVTLPRVDHFLAASELGVTRSQIKRLIDEGLVRIAGAPVKASRKLRDGDEIEVTILPPSATRALPQDIALTILHEDAHLIVVDKPAGMVVHPAPGHPDGTLVNALLAHCGDLSGIGGELRPGIVHRLDKDTSGVLVVSKDDATHNALAARFAAHDMVREYLAVIAPPPAADSGRFDTLYGRHPIHRKKFSSRVTRGKSARTNYRVERRFAGLAALVRVNLETGRTHQIRVHFSDAGMPLIGDPLYGRRGRARALTELASALGRQALHAARLELTHPITGAELAFATPMPADMAALMRGLDMLEPRP